MNGKTSLVCQRLLAATLLVGGLNTLVAPAFADGTAAGTSIDNTATATYEDPSDPTGKPITSTSNTVSVTVAEVAGVTVTGLGTVDANGGEVAINDTVNYSFKVTNVGNDTTELFIPGKPTIVGPGASNTVQITGYIKPDGTRVDFTTANIITVPAAGAQTGTLTTLPPFPKDPTKPALGNYPAGVIPAGYSLIVNVPVVINNLGAAGAEVKVQLGNTPSDGQNQPDSADGKNDNEVRTVDYAGETNGPVADEKEASATQFVTVGSQSQALATILKTRTAYDPVLTTTLADDLISYGLSLKIESAAPQGSTNITPGKLVGTLIQLGAAPAPKVNRILVSDAIPDKTDLTAPGDVVAPIGWTAVYTTDLLTTPAVNATWTTNFDAKATRIGFIYDPGAAGVNAIAEGTTVTGFGFKVVTNGITGTEAVNIHNIAQVFGQTKGNDGPTKPLVYDESGDKLPNNFNDDGTVGNPSTLTPESTTIPTGIPDPFQDGVDDKNNNSGQGPGGEDNVTTIALAGSILNGPNGSPAAVGPTDNNSDFTNRSAFIPAGTVPNVVGGIDPDPVKFTNTIQNPTKDPLTKVLLVPDTKAFAATALPGEELPPDGTKVTITYGTQTATYTYKASLGNFEYSSGVAITIPDLAPGQSINYGVSVDLPAGTKLSTDTEKGFSIPIYAFKDVDGDSRPGTLVAEPTQNRTINRVYTGFLKLTKEARILDKDGKELVPFTTISKDLEGKGATDRFIEYRITYKNISIAPAGNGNGTLNATNISILEEGTNGGAAGGNSWAKDADGNGVIDTSHTMNSVLVTHGTVIYSPSGEQTGKTAATDVTQYVHKPGVIIQPQASGSFTFRRIIN